MFSKACEYGIKSGIYIAGQSMSSKKVSLKKVAAAIGSPEAYTSKILQQLVRHRLIRSEKGPSGGFSIDHSLIDSIKLSAIVKAIDGDEIYTRCGLGLKQCNESKPCPVHDKFVSIRNGLKSLLENTTLQSLALNQENGSSFLK